MIAHGSLSDLIDTIIDDRNENRQWEFYLHKVFDKSYNAFISSMKAEEEARQEDFDVNTTIQESFDIMKAITPEEKDGII